jgi:aromatic ring-opening dioxygenase catalytic subunit (LigB family)
MLTARVLLAPHLPTLLVDQHRGHRTEMLEAYAAAARAFAAEEPAAAVVLSARWISPGAFLADAARRHATLTDYYGFGVEVRHDCPGEPALARALVAAALAGGMRAAAAERGVDSGVTVPMHFLAPRKTLPVVPVSLARRPAAEHRAWGAALRSALDAWSRPVAFVVGGMLSHNVHAWNLGRETPEAQALDARVLEALAGGAWGEIARIESRRHAKAQPEANLLHLEVLRGLLGADLPGTVRCYEAGPGVGAALVEFLVGDPRPVPPPPEPEFLEGKKRDPRLHVPARPQRGPSRPPLPQRRRSPRPDTKGRTRATPDRPRPGTKGRARATPDRPRPGTKGRTRPGGRRGRAPGSGAR